MNLNEAVMAAAITVSIAGVSYAALGTGVLKDQAETVAGEAGCRAVNQAILGYIAQHDNAPKTITDLKPYLQGDISAYRIVKGAAAGPGCTR